MKAIVFLLTLLVASVVFAQPRPGPDGGPPDGPRGRDGRDGRDGPGRDGPMRDGPPGMGGPEMQERMRQFEMFRGYMQMVDQYARIAHEIGRASCRERVEISVGVVDRKKETKNACC